MVWSSACQRCQGCTTRRVPCERTLGKLQEHTLWVQALKTFWLSGNDIVLCKHWHVTFLVLRRVEQIVVVDLIQARVPNFSTFSWPTYLSFCSVHVLQLSCSRFALELIILSSFHSNCSTIWYFYDGCFIFISAKSYESDDEEQSRFGKFSKNFAEIIKHNSEQALGMHSYTLGLNEYADMVSWIIKYSNTVNDVFKGQLQICENVCNCARRLSFGNVFVHE